MDNLKLIVDPKTLFMTDEQSGSLYCQIYFQSNDLSFPEKRAIDTIRILRYWIYSMIDAYRNEKAESSFMFYQPGIARLKFRRNKCKLMFVDDRGEPRVIKEVECDRSELFNLLIAAAKTLIVSSGEFSAHIDMIDLAKMVEEFENIKFS